MKKTAKICAMLLAFALLTGILAACGDSAESSDTPKNFEGIDFSNGNIDFLALHYKPFDSSPDAKLELAQWDGANAAKITPDGSARPYIAIDACSLLGDRISDVAVIEVLMGIENPDGTFHAVQGEILAYSGADRVESKSPWSVFIERANPNTLRMELESNRRMVSGEYNMFIIRRVEDSALKTALRLVKEAENEDEEDEYETIDVGTASNLYILSIGFLDDAGNYLPVDADAKFNEPEGFNESSVRYIELGEMNNINSPTQSGWLTDGTDNKESPYLSEDVSAAQQLVLEFASPPRGEIQIIWHGNGNGWAWREMVVNPGGDLTESTITINLTEMVEYDEFKESEQIKLYIGYFGFSDPCTNCDDASCDLCNRNNMVVTSLTVADLGITRAYLVINE
ncbi:MAG: hypothetical protein LBC82_05365 [Oscillospiraceae bacterium]|nr:hypothetical protein [Oscillospiraceae bacterium]